jgi:hypothetical protein
MPSVLVCNSVQLPDPLRGSPEQSHLTKCVFLSCCQLDGLTKKITATVSSHTGSYNVILGNDILMPASIDMLASTHTIQCFDVTVPWQSATYLSKNTFGNNITEAVNNLSEPVLESFSTPKGVKKILESNYDKL